jgi:hypothetical protein
MGMDIAILAWGSLVWDKQQLSLATEFRPNGPSLPIAFSRVSGDGRLTLVIDDENGMACGTWIAASACRTLAEAMENLRLRESMPSADGIGFFDRVKNKRAEAALQRHPRALRAIETWAAASGHNSVIWTALAANFREKTRRPFSVQAAMDYLASLEAAPRERALAYIRKAPPQIRSLLRTEVDRRWPG